jgi:hypothetical protein
LVAKEDLYSPRHPIANGLFWILGYWEKICPSSIRNMGLVSIFCSSRNCPTNILTTNASKI